MKFIKAQWQAPPHVKALTTTRLGGVSVGVYDGLNLGDHVSDQIEHVQKNRAMLSSELGLARPPQWLSQTHGTEIIKAIDDGVCRQADACWTDEKGVACVVMTADCLPVFFSDSAGNQVAVSHAGWRGLLNGVLENTLAVFDNPRDVHAWLGPAIGPNAFEVGAEVKDQFCDHHSEAITAFTVVDGDDNKYLADIYALARLRLQVAGLSDITSCDLCTYTDKDNFYSYRREGETGRLASLIWIE